MPVDASIPVLGFIGRLDYQKGVDLITESYDWLMDQGVQLIMLGSGRDDLENALRYFPLFPPPPQRSITLDAAP